MERSAECPETLLEEEPAGLLDRAAIARQVGQPWERESGVGRALEEAMEAVARSLAPRSLSACFPLAVGAPPQPGGPAGIWIGSRWFEAPYLARRLAPLAPPRVALFCVTLGSACDALISGLGRRGAVAEAYFADCVASAAISTLTNRVHERLQGAAGARRTFRLSPGIMARSGSGVAYDREHWPLAAQAMFAQLLSLDRLGVRLDQTYWTLQPSKTTTALVPLCPLPSAASGGSSGRGRSRRGPSRRAESPPDDSRA
ncbi:MAG: hypothetical protein HYY96_01455 [Candidatus Tectomicrobia bacterium]|nr:hypothetical protein [Candidatus Tectomicrobia bacterium]